MLLLIIVVIALIGGAAYLYFKVPPKAIVPDVKPSDDTGLGTFSTSTYTYSETPVTANAATTVVSEEPAPVGTEVVNDAPAKPKRKYTKKVAAAASEAVATGTEVKIGTTVVKPKSPRSKKATTSEGK